MSTTIVDVNAFLLWTGSGAWTIGTIIMIHALIVYVNSACEWPILEHICTKTQMNIATDDLRNMTQNNSMPIRKAWRYFARMKKHVIDTLLNTYVVQNVRAAVSTVH